jgi:cell envelope opacity-associated protein A
LLEKIAERLSPDAFFAEKSEPSAPETIALTIPDITTKIAQTGKTETLITEPGITEVQPMPVVNANAPTQSMQNLSTIWQEHKVKSGESLSAIFSGLRNLCRDIRDG